MHSKSYYIVNGITLYRLLAAPVLLFFLWTNQVHWFKWLLPLSFFSDAIDGYLARRYKAGSRFGSILDSIADDLTVIVAFIGLIRFDPVFFHKEFYIIAILFSFFAAQAVMAFIRYGKISSFHTYLAKAAAIMQGTFLILVFHLPEPFYPLFYATALITATELLEEMILVLLLPKWQTNVKGVYWWWKERKELQGTRGTGKYIGH